MLPIVILHNPPRPPPEVFSQLHDLPGLVHNSESYMDFHDVWDISMTEKDRPFMVAKKSLGN